MNNYKFLNISYSSILIVSLLCFLLWVFWDKNHQLEFELEKLQLQHISMESHIKAQNDMVLNAHSQIEQYKMKIQEIELEYILKLKGFEQELAKVKTCDDGLKYLKNTLEKLNKR